MRARERARGRREEALARPNSPFPFPFLTPASLGRDPFDQTFRKFRSKTQWIGSVQPKKLRKIWFTGRDPFIQNSDRSAREKWSISKGGPVCSKLFGLDRTYPLSFGPKFQEILVEWIAPLAFSSPGDENAPIGDSDMGIPAFWASPFPYPQCFGHPRWGMPKTLIALTFQTGEKSGLSITNLRLNSVDAC